MLETKLIIAKDRYGTHRLLATKLYTEVAEEVPYIKDFVEDTNNSQNKKLNIMLLNISSGKAAILPSEWGYSVRTMYLAHKHIEDNFSKLKNCDVIDIQYLVGEHEAPNLEFKLEDLE